MPHNIVDLSARSRIIHEEPWHLHFWESTPQDVIAFLMNPRRELSGMGIDLPDDCRIETVIENHDWLSAHTNGLQAANGPIVVCNVGGGNVAKSYYRVSMYAHHEAEVGKFEKTLLHAPDEEVRDPKSGSPTSQG